MDLTTDTREPLRFGSFELDVRSRELRCGDTRIRLQEQPFEILRLMLERPGDLVTRDELRRRLWPNGTFVDFDHSLNAAVKRLRAALGDDAENPRFVQTLPRRGYRFIAPLVEEQADPSVAGAAPRVRLAVLPFTNLSDGEEYFTDGLTEEMISQLGRLCRGRVGVIARWSSMVFKGTTRRAREIGQALRADFLLEGSVRREGERVRITARLVETTGETHLWAETYERDLVDCLSVQSDVAERIARSLTMELVPEARETPSAVSGDPQAYQAYLKGRYYWNLPGDDGIEQAIGYFQQAVRRDPACAAAHAGLARARILCAECYREVPRGALESARRSARRAIELDASLFEGYQAIGDVRRLLEWDWRGAESAYSQAIVLNPSHVASHRTYGLMLAALSRSADAIRESDRACELDPLCLVVNTSAAWVRYTVGDHDEAIDRCRHTIDMDPRCLAAHLVLGAAYLRSGREAEGLAAMERALQVVGEEPALLAWLAHARAVSGDPAAARALLGRLEQLHDTRHVPGYHLALAHVGLGDADAAFAALERATVDRDPGLANLAIEPRFEPVHDDPRFSRLIDLLGL